MAIPKLADGGGTTQLGAEQCTKFANFGSSASAWSSDGNSFDPDVARINLKAAFGGGLLNSNLDFRVCGQADDNNGREVGVRTCTDWASGGGGDSGFITDNNAFDPDRYRVFIDTQPLPPGAGFNDFRTCIRARDAGEGDGNPACTGWASQNGGVSPFARDQNGFDPDGFVLMLDVV